MSPKSAMLNTTKYSSIEKLPEEVFRHNIMKYLSPEDIFHLGEVSQRMKEVILRNLSHPLATFLQYLKTVKSNYYKICSPYDDVDTFENSELCREYLCECQKFHKRKSVVILDPLYCEDCNVNNRYQTCGLHNLLMTNMMDYAICYSCSSINSYCESCTLELDR